MASSIYLIKSGLHCKIGKSNDVGKRLGGLQTSSPFPMEVLWTTEFDSERDALDAEAELHKRYQSRRTRGEWFWFHPRIESAVAEMGDQVAQLSASDMGDWVRVFAGESIPSGVHVDGAATFACGAMSPPAWVDSDGVEYGFTMEWGGEPTGFFKLVPHGSLVTVSFEGEMRAWSRRRIERLVDLSGKAQSLMYREAQGALDSLLRNRITGVTTANEVFEGVYRSGPRMPRESHFPSPDLYAAAREEWEFHNDALDDLMAMGYIVSLESTPYFMHADSAALVWSTPALAVRTRDRQLQPPGGGKGEAIIAAGNWP